MSLSESIREEIVAEVEKNFSSQVSFTAEMVRFPSTRGNEASMQDFMAEAFRARGLDVDHWKIDVDDIKHLPGFAPVVDADYAQAYNVVGSYRPNKVNGRSLILNGHIDVVPPGDASRWTKNPFEPWIQNGRMYGRGAGDMKAGLAAALFAFDAIRNAGFKVAAPLHIQSVVEEECTGNGTLACLQRGYRADCALVPEPFGPKLMRAEVGLLWVRVRVQGDPQHASAGFNNTGANAIEKAIHIWPYIKRLEAEWNARKTSHPVYRNHPHPIRVNLGKISGGDWVSSVPALAQIEIRIGKLPHESLADIRDQIVARIGEACADDPYLAEHPPEITFHGHMAEGFVLEGAEEAEEALGSAHQSIFAKPLEDLVTSAVTDARFFSLYQNIPGLVYGPICGLPHGIDEYVELESVKDVTKVIALFIAEWCGVILAEDAA